MNQVSVIIPAYNAAKTLPACLTALNNQTVPRESYEIIVVDDGSTDATAATAAAAGARVLHQNHLNQAAGRNTGANAATGDLLLFTDADCVPAHDWIEAMCRPFADTRVVAAKGRYRTEQPGLVPRFVQQEFEEKYSRLERQETIDFVDTYSAAYRRDAYLAAGGFDPAFTVVEDIELSFRLAATGARLVFISDAVVAHQHRDSMIRYVQRKREAGRWWVAVYGRHPGKVGSDSRQPRTVLIQIMLATAITALLPLAVVIKPFRTLLGALSGGFLATTVPMTRRSFQRDPGVAALVPAMVFARSFFQGIGILEGVAGRLLKRSTRG